MKLDLAKRDLKAKRPPSRAGAFLRALGANWLVLAGIGAIYVLFVAGAWALREPVEGGTMDIVFVFDTTGSMVEEMAGTVRTSRRFAERLSQSHVDWRLALVAFGANDEKPRPVVRATLPFTDRVEEFRNALGALKAEGGGNEDQITALNHALTNLAPRPKATAIYILITDEPYADPSECGRSFREVKEDLKGRKVRVYAVTDNEDVQSTEDFRALATETGGKWYDIHGPERFTEILDRIARHIATSIVR